MKYRGCAYYPEYWGRERFRIDAELMRDAGINIARIGEFAWVRMEPAEGEFTLDWLHECVSTLSEFGIDVLMCTPSATPPAWLTQAYPDTLAVSIDGRRLMHGNRRHYCMSSDTFRRHCARITEKLGQEIGRHGNVIAWQIDNELGPEATFCHCDNCQSHFRTWLRNRYGTIEGLNDAWKTGFWSVDYSDWSQVFLQDWREGYSSRNLDSRRFFSDLTVDFCMHQAAILRASDPGSIVTTNGMGPIFTPVDYYKLFENLDVACDDLYFDIATMDLAACAMDIYRNYKPGRRYWITETGSGALDHNKAPHPDQFRAWMWSAFAHGSEAHMVFRWRTCLSGHEQELQGILEHSGKPRHRYRAVQRAFQEMIELGPKIDDLPLPAADVALIMDYDTIWGYESSRMGVPVDYLGHFYRTYSWFYEKNVPVDVVPQSADLGGYKAVVIPTLMIVDPEFTPKLKAFIESGGVVLATGQIGMRDANDNYLIEPDPIQALFGMRIEGGMYLRSFIGPDEGLWVPKESTSMVDVPLAKSGEGARSFVASRWIADLSLAGGTATATYTADCYEGQPAVVENTLGRGKTLYLGTVYPDDALLDDVLSSTMRKAGVEPNGISAKHVEIMRRGHMTFIINHTAQREEVQVADDLTAVIGEVSGGKVKLAPFGVAVLEGER